MQCPTTHDSKNSSCQSCPLSSSCSKSKDFKFDFSQFVNKRGLIIMSGKGGVGKSSISKMMAHTIQRHLSDSCIQESICLIDGDTKGPSLGRLFSIEEIYPKESLPCKIPNTEMYLISNSIIDTPLPLPALLNIRILSQFLVIDTPPGITDEHLFLKDLSTVCKLFVLIVTTSDDICISDVRRQMSFLKKINVVILGIIVNMEGFECKFCAFHNESYNITEPENSIESLLTEFDIKLLGKLEAKQEIANKCDSGDIFEKEFFDGIFKQFKRIFLDSEYV